MESNTRFSIYRQFKHCFEREYYVDVIWININRNAFAQFRERERESTGFEIFDMNALKMDLPPLKRTMALYQ